MSGSDIDIDRILRAKDEIERSHQIKRQDNFEVRLLRKFLSDVEPEAGASSKWIRGCENEFGFDWFNTTFSTFPFKMAAYKMSELPGLAIAHKFEDTELAIAWDDLQDVYPDDKIALVFDIHSKGFRGAMVLHTVCSELSGTGQWQIQLHKHKAVITPFSAFTETASRLFDFGDNM
jgi:hypothetical protein